MKGTREIYFVVISCAGQLWCIIQEIKVKDAWKQETLFIMVMVFALLNKQLELLS